MLRIVVMEWILLDKRNDVQSCNGCGTNHGVEPPKTSHLHVCIMGGSYSFSLYKGHESAAKQQLYLQPRGWVLLWEALIFVPLWTIIVWNLKALHSSIRLQFRGLQCSYKIIINTSWYFFSFTRFHSFTSMCDDLVLSDSLHWPKVYKRFVTNKTWLSRHSTSFKSWSSFHILATLNYQYNWFNF